MSAPDHRPLPVQTGPAPRSEPPWARIPFHPLLLALALVAVAYIQTDVSIWAVIRTLGVVLVGTLLVLTLAILVTRNRHLGALVTAALLLLLRTTDVPHAIAGLALLGLAAVALRLFARVRRSAVLPAATRLLNLGTVALVAVLVAQAVATGLASRIGADVGRSPVARGTSSPVVQPPDVYVLLLEDYPRADTLQRLFAYDNSRFLGRLRADGFTVAGDSRSNYMYTGLNLAALLHMTYLADLPQVRAWEAGNGPQPSLRTLINDSPVLSRLREAGYTVFSSVARWESEALHAADVSCGSDQLNEFEVQFLRDSLVGTSLDAIASGWQAARDRSVVNAELSCARAASEASVSRPRFVWAHIEAPHIPVVFDAHGGAAPASVYTDTAQAVNNQEEFRRAYLAELEYLNARVLDLIGRIQPRSTTPPVIIVMSDEGSESHLDWQVGARSDLRERFGTLFAASTPGHPALFGERPVTVNVFAALLNAYFGTAIPIQPPRYFVSSIEGRLDLAEITDPFARAPSP